MKCKPGQNKDGYRGELEIRTSFTVKSVDEAAAGAGKKSKKHKEVGSVADLQAGSKEKHKGSLTSLGKKASGLGGSLMSLGSKEKKNLKKLAGKVGSKVEKVGEKAKRTLSRSNLSGSKSKLDDSPGPLPNKFNMDESNRNGSFQRLGDSRASRGSRNRDPGVESDEEEDDMFRFDALSHRSSGSSLNVRALAAAGGSVGGRGGASKTSTPMGGSIENVGK